MNLLRGLSGCLLATLGLKESKGEAVSVGYLDFIGVNTKRELCDKTITNNTGTIKSMTLRAGLGPRTTGTSRLIPCARAVATLFITFRRQDRFVVRKFTQHNIICCANIVCGL
jgi:hypothetical protein